MKKYLPAFISGSLGLCVGLAFSHIHPHPETPAGTATMSHSDLASLPAGVSGGSDLLVHEVEEGNLVLVTIHDKPYAIKAEPWRQVLMTPNTALEPTPTAP